MEENKQIKISLKTAILISLAILVVIFGVIFLIYHIQTSPSSSITSSEGLTSTTTIYADTNKSIPTASNVTYSVYSASVSAGYLTGLDNIFVTSNSELKQNLYKCIGTNSATIYDRNSKETISISEYFNDEFFLKNNLAIEMYDESSSHHSYSISSVIKSNSTATINIKDNFSTYGGPFPPRTTLVCITLDKEIKNVNFDIYRTTTNNSYESDHEVMFIAGIIISIVVIIVVGLIISRHNKKVDSKYNLEQNSKKQSKLKKVIITIIIAVLILVAIFFSIVFYEATMMPNTTSYKPIIYLYPTEETEVSVNLGYSDKITCSYPQYTTGWNVLAKPNGDLIDLDSGRNLYSLYYESTNVVDFDIKSDGFVVKGTDVAKFLEEKLAILGLTERESEEFIVYWLPKLQENKYNYIRFAATEEINANMPLELSVEPDTLIRVLMTYKGLNNPIDVEEQQLKTPDRTGFVAVEWGGTEIK